MGSPSHWALARWIMGLDLKLGVVSTCGGRGSFSYPPLELDIYTCRSPCTLGGPIQIYFGGVLDLGLTTTRPMDHVTFGISIQNSKRLQVC